MPDAAAVPKTPDEQLARIVVQGLVDQKLLDSSKRDEVERKLARGGLSANDWRLLFELHTPDSKKVMSKHGQA